MIRVEPYPPELLQRAKELQSVLALPDELNTVYFVARILRAHNDDEAVKRVVATLQQHRALLNYAGMSEMHIYTQLFPRVFSRFSVSRLTGSPRSGNVNVFVQKMKGVHLKDILTTIPAGDVLHAYFALQEIFGRQLCSTEKETGEPSALVTILDLNGLNLSEYLNPLSVNCKLAKYIVSVWAEYFSETLIRILIINSPGLISLMWTITKHIVDARTASRLVFLTDTEQLKDYLEPAAIPVEYGGEWVDRSGFSDPPQGCATKAREVTPEQAMHPHHVWRERGLDKPPPSSSHIVKYKKPLDIKCTATGEGHIAYSFTTTGELVFSIVRVEKGKEVTVWQGVRCSSLIVPEQGSLPVSHGEFILRFTNPSSSWLSPKVNVSSQFFPADSSSSSSE